MTWSIITRDDINALTKAIKFRGLLFLFNKLKINRFQRIKAHWENYQSMGSNWWDIPQVRNRWNLKITGNKEIPWEEYIIGKYFNCKTNLSLLSVGCGTGEKERIFGRYLHFSEVVGVDISETAINKAKIEAQKQKFKIEYRQLNFATGFLKHEPFNVILFNSSLHHFKNIEKLLSEKVLPILKPDGLLIMFEYVGSNRFQYTQQQIEAANQCLSILPAQYKLRKDGTIKSKNYRPGLLRMWLNDPSEAPDSDDIMPSLRKLLNPIEEKPIGGAVLHMLLKDIAHNFVNESTETSQLLELLFQEEDKFFQQTGQSDFWFGVYGKR